MIQNLILKTEHLQADLIVSDIPHSGKAYLLNWSKSENFMDEVTQADLTNMLADARQLALALQAVTLLVGFRPTGPVAMPTPDHPPAGFVFHTGFIRLTGSVRTLASAAGNGSSIGSVSHSGSIVSPSVVRLVPMSADQAGIYLKLHREGMRGVPNVPAFTEADIRKKFQSDRLFLIETPGGLPIGVCDLKVSPGEITAHLEEIALLPAWRGRGIGRKAIAELALGLVGEGVEHLTLLVATVNTSALRLYRKIGFGQEQPFANWFRQPLNRHETVGPIHTAKELATDLRHLGVKPGQTLMVHSSLKSLGWIPGGPVALIEALLTAVGPAGTIVMPAQSGDNSDPEQWIAPPVPKDYWPVIRASMPAYDPRVTPTRAIGRVAELFRTWPGVLRSPHPSCSFSAIGPNAQAITQIHPLSDALGEDSPGKKLIDLDAFVLQIGTDFDTCTLMHLAEYRTRCRPRTKQGASVLTDGRRSWQTYEDIQMNSDEFIEPGRLMEERGLVTTGKVGEASCRLFKAAAAVETAGEWFSAHRMRRLRHEDRDWLLAYLEREPAYNLFLIGDIENFGFDVPFQDLMAYRREHSDRVDSVLLRYHRNFIVYSDLDDFETEPVLSALTYPGLNVLSAKKSVMDRLKPWLEDYRFRDMYLMRRSVCRPGNENDQPAWPVGLPDDDSSSGPAAHDGIVLATPANAPELAAFLHGIEEFRQIGTTLEQRTEEITRSLSTSGTRYVLVREDGRIIACAGTTAENSRSAMVVGVATAPDHRGLGLASRLVSRLCALHQMEGRDFLCLFYDNPSAGVIYRRLGFTDVGTWVMATPPKLPDTPLSHKKERKHE